MEDLLRALRNIGLATPEHEQLLQLSDRDPEVQDKLAQLIALNPSTSEYEQDPVEQHDDEDEMDLDPLMDADLFKGAVAALLENYNNFIDKERDLLERERAMLASPKPLKRVPLKALLARQDAEIKRRNEEYHAAGHDPETGKKKKKFYLSRQTFDGYGSYASGKNFLDLKRIDYDELVAPKRFEDRYVLLRVQSRLNLYVSCTFIATMLPSGAAIPVSISHFTTNLHLRGEELDRHLPIGTLIAIREPYISLKHFGKGGPATGGKAIHGIRVDTPSDVYIVDGGGGHDFQELSDEDCDPMVSLVRPRELNLFGSLWMQEGLLTRLSRDMNVEDSGCVEKNATNAFDLIGELLKVGRPGTAYRELVQALRLADHRCPYEDEKRRPTLEGRVLHALGQYKLAVEKFDEALLDADEGKREAIYPLSLASKAALKASQNGPTHENVWSYYFESSSLPTPRFDQADWLGPVEVRDIPGAGRGLVLTRDVEEGELLLSCKVLASSYAADAGVHGIAVLRHDVETGVTSTTTQVIAATRTIHTLMDRTELIPMVMGLTAGPSVPYSPWVSKPYPVPPEPRKFTQRDEWLPEINAGYIDGVLRFNAFGPSPNPAHGSSPSELTRSTMVHPLPAILNHACLPNVSSVFFGDVVTTRALHPLKAGTEIMHQYVRGEQPWPLRRSQLRKHGFVCACGICKLDQADGEDMCRERQRLVGGTMGMLSERSRMIAKSDDKDAHRDFAEALTGLADEVDKTYSQDRGVLRPDLTAIWHAIAKHTAKFDTEAAVQAELKALTYIGATVQDAKLTRLPDLHFDAAITSLLSLAHLAPADEAKWVHAAMHAHESTIGGGPDVFLDRWEAAYPHVAVRKHLK